MKMNKEMQELWEKFQKNNPDKANIGTLMDMRGYMSAIVELMQVLDALNPKGGVMKVEDLKQILGTMTDYKVKESGYEALMDIAKKNAKL